MCCFFFIFIFICDNIHTSAHNHILWNEHIIKPQLIHLNAKFPLAPNAILHYITLPFLMAFWLHVSEWNSTLHSDEPSTVIAILKSKALHHPALVTSKYIGASFCLYHCKVKFVVVIAMSIELLWGLCACVPTNVYFRYTRSGTSILA